MADAYVDTDVIMRFLTGDDPTKQAEAASLFEAVEAGTAALAAPDTVIADAVYVLASPRLYHLPRTEIRSLLVPLLRLSGLHVENKRTIIQALDLYAATTLDFGDAMIVGTMRQSGSDTIYSYDQDFDHIPGLTRANPAESPPNELR
jgi:predicted nucleic acid-binding protein